MNSSKQISYVIIGVLLLTLLPFNYSYSKVKIEASAVKRYEGQTIYNRVMLRTWKKNRIWFTNMYHMGIIILPGTECHINEITKKYISFTAGGQTYYVVEWLLDVKDESEQMIQSSFDKFFIKDRSDVGLENVNTAFQNSISAGIEEIGMTKEEALLCLGYPSYFGMKTYTKQFDRNFILSQNNWFYKTQGFGGKVMLIFEGGKLTRIIK